MTRLARRRLTTIGVRPTRSFCGPFCHTRARRVSNQAQEDKNVTVTEIQTLAQRLADGYDKNDMKSVLEMLSEDVEVFTHVPYRSDGKQLFAKYLNETFGAIGSTSFGFRQPSCRVYNDNVGIVNAYDMFVGATKDGRA